MLKSIKLIAKTFVALLAFLTLPTSANVSQISLRNTQGNRSFEQSIQALVDTADSTFKQVSLDADEFHRKLDRLHSKMMNQIETQPDSDSFEHTQNTFLGLSLGFLLVVLVIAAVSFIFWIWMLIDCATHETSEENQKIIWLLLIFFLHSIGALVYFFARRRPRIQAEKA